MTVKEQLAAIIEELTDAQAEDELRRLTALRDDPFLRRLYNVPLEDEEITDEENAAVDVAIADGLASADCTSLDDVIAELGLE
jgi:hypothetical protein